MTEGLDEKKFTVDEKADVPLLDLLDQIEFTKSRIDNLELILTGFKRQVEEYIGSKNLIHGNIKVLHRKGSVKKVFPPDYLQLLKYEHADKLVTTIGEPTISWTIKKEI